MLRASGRVFQLTWWVCLPWALVGVLASGVPGAEAAASGEGRGLSHSPSWWALAGASALLTLLCYGTLMLRQHALLAGQGGTTLEALQRCARRLPSALVAGLVTLLASLLILPLPWLSLAWTVALMEGCGPLQACRRSVVLVRGRALAVTGSYLATLAAVVVFVMLAGICLGVVMMLAGPPGLLASAGLSRVLMAALLSLPVVFVSAVLLSVYGCLTRIGQSPT